jgi:two-component system cell cycle response regulator CpdR
MNETQIPINYKILLAEDDHDMRRFLGKALQNAGYDVASFDNGLSAYHRLREEPFELLLTDIVMPEMDGIRWLAGANSTRHQGDVHYRLRGGRAQRGTSAPPQEDPIETLPFEDLVNEVQRLLAA